MASIVVAGDTSGTVTLSAPSVAGTTTLTLPTTSGTLITTGGGAAGSFTTLTSTQDASFATSSGNVGIGTSSPVSKQQISKGSAPTTISKANAYLGLGASENLVNSYRLIGFGYSSTETQYPAYIGYTETNNSGATYGDLTFYTRNVTTDTTPTERMRIDSNGGVQIGTTLPYDPLSGFSFYTAAGGTNSQIHIGHASGTASGIYYIVCKYNGTSIGGITQNGTTAVAYNTSSDYRLKEKIVPMTGALNKVAQLKPVTYTWKSDGSDGQGFIAHELQEHFPEAVSGEKDAVDENGKPIYQGVDTSFLVATLTKAIQEQQTIIETLKADIAELKAKVK